MRWRDEAEKMLLNSRQQDVVLSVKNLKVEFRLPGNVIQAVNGISFEVRRGRITALVGESGCGKSVTAMSIMGLLECKGSIIDGEILVSGQDVRGLSAKQRHSYCGVQVGVVFQDPVNSLDPLFSIGDLVSETIRAHRNITRREARAQSVELLRRMHLPDPEGIMNKYPFQLSGGMCQRVMIAIAMAMHPPLLIADEPTTALDVTIQAQILDQICTMSRETQTGVLFITHDLGVVAEIADDIYIMKEGMIVEAGTVLDVFHCAQHDYTKQLLNAIL
ncbi:ABC transporter ATP-binding protein [Desulfosporosinus sp. BICA1-9]|uniref:ABC transporter ATP-binding protein n=1 Tax=Desulfosporosinus sp. BICA1-9 TaxID=1531958 RepID=UPI000A4FE675|nr:ABC transporter ATP-binding protein [Desulfosporosinus sp. BICA1-9]